MPKFKKGIFLSLFVNYTLFHNFIIYIFLKFSLKLFNFKKVYIFNLLTRILHIGNFCFSYYGVKLFNPNFEDPTFRYCNGGAYGEYYSNFLLNYGKDFNFIDIGANIGIYTLIARKNKKCLNIYSFEPNNRIFQDLTKNISSSENINTFNFAISSDEGEEKFFIDPKSSGSSRISAELSNSFIKTVNFQFLKKILYKKKNLIIKIDVEGHEKVVLDQILKSVDLDDIKSIFIEIENKDQIVKYFEEKLKKFILAYSSKNNKRCDFHFIN